MTQREIDNLKDGDLIFWNGSYSGWSLMLVLQGQYTYIDANFAAYTILGESYPIFNLFGYPNISIVTDDFQITPEPDESTSRPNTTQTRICDCGGEKCHSTHYLWCSSLKEHK